MIIHMTRITRLTPLTHLDTAGIQILDLRRSSQTPEPGASPAPGKRPGGASAAVVDYRAMSAPGGRSTPAPATAAPAPTSMRELTEVGARHADGRAAAPLLAPGRPRAATRPRRHAPCVCWARTWCSSATGTGGPGLVIRAAPIAAPRSTTARSRSAASAAAITAGCSTSTGHCLEQPCEPDGGRAARARAPALVPGRGALRAGLRLSRPAGEEAGAAALRLRWRRCDAGRVRRGRRSAASAAAAPAIIPVQLAAALRERGRPATTCRSCTAPSAAPQFAAQMGLMPKVKLRSPPRGREGDLRPAAARRHAHPPRSPRRCCRPCA